MKLSRPSQAKFFLILFALFWARSSWADDMTPQQKAAFQSAIDAANAATIPGPTTIDVGGVASVALPKGYNFVPTLPTQNLMRALSIKDADIATTIGLIDDAPIILADDDGMDDWDIDLSYRKLGHVREDGWDQLDAEKLLAQIRKTAETGNPDRLKQGLPALVVDGWSEVPHYDAMLHSLVFSLLVHTSTDPHPSSDYNILMLGREGAIGITLSTHHIDLNKAKALEILAATHFKDGQRYEDFNARTDQVAKYGLSALVLGVGAQKLGLFALLAGLAVKSWKLILVGLVGVKALLGFKKKKLEADKSPTDNLLPDNEKKD